MRINEDHGIEIEDGVGLPLDGRDVYYFPEPQRIALQQNFYWHSAMAELALDTVWWRRFAYFLLLAMIRVLNNASALPAVNGAALQVTRVTARNGKTWYAATALDRYRPDVIVMPDRKRVFVRGFLIDAENPLRWERVPLVIVEQCMISPNGNWAVMRDNDGVAGYCVDGLYWLVRPGHLEGLRFTGIDNHHVYISASVDPEIDEPCPIGFHVSTGDLYISGQG